MLQNTNQAASNIHSSQPSPLSPTQYSNPKQLSIPLKRSAYKPRIFDHRASWASADKQKETRGWKDLQKTKKPSRRRKIFSSRCKSSEFRGSQFSHTSTQTLIHPPTPMAHPNPKNSSMVKWISKPLNHKLQPAIQPHIEAKKASRLVHCSHYPFKPTVTFHYLNRDTLENAPMPNFHCDSSQLNQNRFFTKKQNGVQRLFSPRSSFAMKPKALPNIEPISISGDHLLSFKQHKLSLNIHSANKPQVASNNANSNYHQSIIPSRFKPTVPNSSNLTVGYNIKSMIQSSVEPIAPAAYKQNEEHYRFCAPQTKKIINQKTERIHHFPQESERNQFCYQNYYYDKDVNGSDRFFDLDLVQSTPKIGKIEDKKTEQCEKIVSITEIQQCPNYIDYWLKKAIPSTESLTIERTVVCFLLGLALILVFLQTIY